MSVTFAKGFSAAGVAAGISSVEGKKDLALVVNQGPLDSAAGVFTFNRFCAAPVQWSRKTVADGHIKAVILNSGGANACTGQAGYEQSAATAKKVADLVGSCKIFSLSGSLTLCDQVFDLFIKDFFFLLKSQSENITEFCHNFKCMSCKFF